MTQGEDVEIITIVVNGAKTTVADGSCVLDVARLVGLGDDEPGVAIALDGVVVQRSEWSKHVLAADATVEVVRASAGG